MKRILVDMDGVLVDIYTSHNRVSSWAEIEKLLLPV